MWATHCRQGVYLRGGHSHPRDYALASTDLVVQECNHGGRHFRLFADDHGDPGGENGQSRLDRRWHEPDALHSSKSELRKPTQQCSDTGSFLDYGFFLVCLILARGGVTTDAITAVGSLPDWPQPLQHAC